MKMKGKSLKTIVLGLAGALVCSSVAMAAPSPAKNGTVSQKFLINGQEADPDKYQATFDTKLEELNLEPQVLESIQEINRDPEKVTEVLKEAMVAESDTIDVGKLQTLTQIQDLSIIDKETGKIMDGAENVTMTWEVPALVEDMGEVRVLHYSTVRNIWEILKPEEVDYEHKSVTQYFEDLSPVAVVYVPKEAGAAGAGQTATVNPGKTNIKTGDSSTMWLYVGVAAAAAVLVCAWKGRKRFPSA